jgi:hypothetical protein
MFVRTMGLLPFVFALVSATAFAKPSAFDERAVAASGLVREQAKQVLLVVLKHEHYKLRGDSTFINGDLVDEKGNPPHPGYYDFSLGDDSAGEGATHYRGLFSVSILTGDVWELNLCKRFVFPQLKRIQTAIMKRTGRTLADEKAARKGLGCTDD